jgi:hypothetical protein
LYEAWLIDRDDRGYQLWSGRFTVRVPAQPDAVDPVADVAVGDDIVVSGRWSAFTLFTGAKVWLHRVDVDPAGNERVVFLESRAVDRAGSTPVRFSGRDRPGLYEAWLIDRDDRGYQLWSGRFRLRLAPLVEALTAQRTAGEEPDEGGVPVTVTVKGRLADSHVRFEPQASVVRARTWVPGGASRDERLVVARPLAGAMFEQTFSLGATGDRYVARVADRSRDRWLLGEDLDLGVVAPPPIDEALLGPAPDQPNTIRAVRVVPADPTVLAADDPESLLDAAYLVHGRSYRVAVEYSEPVDALLPDREVTIEVNGRSLTTALEPDPEDRWSALSEPFTVGDAEER